MLDILFLLATMSATLSTSDHERTDGRTDRGLETLACLKRTPRITSLVRPVVTKLASGINACIMVKVKDQDHGYVQHTHSHLYIENNNNEYLAGDKSASVGLLIILIASCWHFTNTRQQSAHLD